MKFTVENESFAKALGLVKSCILARSTIPILTHIVIEAGRRHLDDNLNMKVANSITVRATNMEREAEAECPAQVETAGAAALPGEVLSAMARKLLKGGQASVALDGDRCKIVAGSSRYNLRVLPAADYPARKELGEGAVVFAVEPAVFCDLIRSTVYAAADRGETREMFRGIHLHVADRKLIAVATDDKRFALKSIEIPKGAATMPAVIVSSDTARSIIDLLAGVADPVETAFTTRAMQIKWPAMRFASQLIDAKFPDYHRIIPKSNGHAVTFRPYALSEAIARASIVYLGEVNTDAKFPLTVFSIANGNIELECGAKANEQATETVEAETNGAELKFRANANHMIEMLGIWPESVDVSVQQVKPGAPIMFTAKDRSELHLVMPSVKGEGIKP